MSTESDDIVAVVMEWFSTYIRPFHDDDLAIVALWAIHTHLCAETYTTPRLTIDSPTPGSGKTTLLEHFGRLCMRPVQMASVSSAPLLVRLVNKGPRTLLIDEADRTLDPKREGVNELVAVLNSGYKRGGTRPVLVPAKDDWVVREMPTFAPVAMAGNAPDLPDDTRTRSIRVLLLPDLEGEVCESDWEVIDQPARELGARIAAWADSVREDVRRNRPELPAGVIGRARERWAPLKRVADAAGGQWPGLVDRLAVQDIVQLARDREDGMVITSPGILLLTHLLQTWPAGVGFMATTDLTARLASEHPDVWGVGGPFKTPITAQRFGRMLSRGFRVNSVQSPVGTRPRGYTFASLMPTWRRMGFPAAGLDARNSGAANVSTEGVCKACRTPLGTADLESGTGLCGFCEINQVQHAAQ